MQIRTTLLSLILLWGCGNTTSIDSRKLESFSNITNAGKVTLDQTGTLQRGIGSVKDVIITSGASYKISMYSSYSALEFVSAKPPNHQENVKFKGEIRGDEIILEAIQGN